MSKNLTEKEPFYFEVVNSKSSRTGKRFYKATDVDKNFVEFINDYGITDNLFIEDIKPATEKDYVYGNRLPKASLQFGDRDIDKFVVLDMFKRSLRGLIEESSISMTQDKGTFLCNITADWLKEKN